MNVINFIIIDDDRVFRETLTRSLTRLDCHVENFANPSDALSAIETTVSLTVLLDLKLESDSGLRWIEAIRQTNEDANIILLTGYASISTAVEAIKLGANDYLPKPITGRLILEHLRNKDISEPTIKEKPMSVERLEWEHIHRVMQDNDGNVSATARALSMHRRTLQRKLAKKPVQD